ncbi:MAG: CO dehydrogenase/acetyl-CoA synthase complex subunit epsilon [Nitrososphaerota archaeon]
MAEPWQRAETAGPLRAMLLVKPDAAVALIKKSKRPILVAGKETVELTLSSGRPIEYVVKIAEAAHIPVVAVAATAKMLIQLGYQPAAMMGTVDLANRLTDPSWSGFDGLGNYDMLIMLGLPYYVGWLVLSGLKHFAPNLITLSLDRYYQPHASWSFPNLSDRDWEENLRVIVRGLGGKM